MTLYVDTSALLKRYVEEPESARCERALLADPVWVTARITFVETRRNLARLLSGAALERARAAFERDFARMHVVELDETTCRLAAGIAESLGVRSLDALHLGAASRLGPADVVLLTFDRHLARAARELGFSVRGV